MRHVNPSTGNTDNCKQIYTISSQRHSQCYSCSHASDRSNSVKRGKKRETASKISSDLFIHLSITLSNYYTIIKVIKYLRCRAPIEICLKIIPRYVSNDGTWGITSCVGKAKKIQLTINCLYSLKDHYEEKLIQTTLVQKTTNQRAPQQFLWRNAPVCKTLRMAWNLRWIMLLYPFSPN